MFGKEMNLPIDTSLIPKTEMGLDGVSFDQMYRNLGKARQVAGENIIFCQEKLQKTAWCYGKGARIQSNSLGSSQKYEVNDRFLSHSTTWTKFYVHIGRY